MAVGLSEMMGLPRLNGVLRLEEGKKKANNNQKMNSAAHGCFLICRNQIVGLIK